MLSFNGSIFIFALYLRRIFYVNELRAHAFMAFSSIAVTAPDFSQTLLCWCSIRFELSQTRECVSRSVSVIPRDFMFWPKDFMFSPVLLHFYFFLSILENWDWYFK